jgi:acyl carrier protein
MNVDARIRRYLETAIAEPISDTDDFFERGFVNSLFAIQLVTFVEQEFSITAEREDLDINNFSSVATLTQFVRRKLGELPESGESE